MGNETAKTAAKTARDVIQTDLKNIIETAGKNRVGISEIRDRLFGPIPPSVDKATGAIGAMGTPFGMVNVVEAGLDEIRHIQNDAYEILADILGKL